MDHTPTPRERSRPHIDDFQPSVSKAEKVLLYVIGAAAIFVVFTAAAGYLYGRCCA